MMDSSREEELRASSPHVPAAQAEHMRSSRGAYACPVFAALSILSLQLLEGAPLEENTRAIACGLAVANLSSLTAIFAHWKDNP
jgi:hypothetical protein